MADLGTRLRRLPSDTLTVLAFFSRKPAFGYRLTAPRWDALPAGLRRAAMSALVVIGWVPFRAPDFDTTMQLLATLFGVVGGAELAGTQLLVPMLLLAGGIAHFARNSWEMDHQWRPLPALGFAALFVLCLGLIYAGQRMPFLYFQF